jgi:drug/metabolite transporter (DMT)-like permease
VARAKRTDRAEARRRYRASLGDPLEIDDLEADEADNSASNAASAPTRTGGRSAAGGPARSAPPPATRPSMGAAFRSSFRPVDLRGDLRALPMLLRHKAFLVPVILSGAAVALLPLVGVNALTSAFYQYFSFTAPLGTAFLAGFFAPRASWLVGMLAALASVGFQAWAFTVGPFGGLYDNFLDANGQAMTRSAAEALVLNQALIVGVPSAALFASAAAWYKRFLGRASPNRNRPAQAGRRPDGKQPKRNEARPILARRR